MPEDPMPIGLQPDHDSVNTHPRKQLAKVKQKGCGKGSASASGTAAPHDLVMKQPLDISLSSWSLGLNSPVLRRPSREWSLRHADFEDKYDFQTVFYDCFWSAGSQHLTLIGPPLLNLENELGLRFFAMPSDTECRPVSIARAFITLLSLAVPQSLQYLRIESAAGTAFLVPQPNLSGVFKDRRVLMTLSQNNELEWIRDWIIYHQRLHGCDAALIYDNNSMRYDISGLKACLAAIPGIAGLVVNWPYRYGPFDGRLPLTYDLWEGHFCQFGMLEHARWRFLASANCSLNLDIDELVVSDGQQSIFAQTQASRTGYLKLGGKWVENHHSSDLSASTMPLHRDFWHRTAGWTQGCESKWAAVPAMIPLSAQFGVHDIFGHPDSEPTVHAEIRHFKALNTNWSVDRPGRLRQRTQVDITADDLVEDRQLRTLLDGAFRHVERAFDIPTARDNDTSALQWRQKSALLLKNNNLPEAEEAAREAVGKAPDWPALRLHLALILERRGEHGQAMQEKDAARRLQDSAAVTHYVRGRYLLHTGEYGNAARHFGGALKRDPRFAPAYHALARLYWAAGLPVAAERFLRRGLTRIPSSGLLHQSLAEILLYAGRHDDALWHANAALETDRYNGDLEILRARLFQAIGEPQHARAAAERGVDLQTNEALRLEQLSAATERPFKHSYPTMDSLAARLVLIRCLLQASATDIALTESERALDIFANRALAYEGCYLALTASGDDNAAARYLGEAIRLASRDLAQLPPQTLGRFKEREWYEGRMYHLWCLLTAAGWTTEALAVLRTALKLYPESHLASLHLVYSLNDLGETGEARSLLAASVRKFPRHPELWREHGRMLEAAGEEEQAISAYRHAVRLGARQAWLMSHLAHLLLQREEFAEAGTLLAEAVRLDGKHALSHYRLSEVLWNKGEVAKALDSCRKAADLLPEAAWLWSHLGGRLIDANLLEEAEVALNRAEALQTGDMLTQYRLGRLWENRGSTERALHCMSKALALDPGHGWLWRHYSALLLKGGSPGQAEEALRRAVAAESPPKGTMSNPAEETQ